MTDLFRSGHVHVTLSEAKHLWYVDSAYRWRQMI